MAIKMRQLLVSGFCLSLASAGTAQPSIMNWAGSRVYVFSSYILDLNRLVETYIPARLADVRDCSDDKFYCLRSVDRIIGVASFVVPKRCPSISVGTTWSSGSMTTRIVAKLPLEPYAKEFQRSVLLATDIQPDVMFTYAPLTGIYEVHFGNNLAAAYEAEGKMPAGVRTERLRTIDQLAACKRG